MKSISGNSTVKEITPGGLKASVGCEVEINACVHKTGRLGGAKLVLLRTGRYVIQSVCAKDFEGDTITEGAYICARGIVKDEPRAPYGIEIELKSTKTLSLPSSEYPLRVSNRVLESTLETNLAHRSVSLRHPLARAVFRISDSVKHGFEEYLRNEGFVNVRTPEIIRPTGERNMLPLRYFDKDAVLSRSPQLYLQMSVGFFDRVFESAAVFRAEKHNSARHLCEYEELDLAMGYIRSLEDIMQLLTALLRHIAETVSRECKHETELLGTDLPQITDIPSVTFREALDILGKDSTQADLDPTDADRLCRYASEKYGSELIFVTHFPPDKRPFYIKDSTDGFTESFDLLFRGMKIASGGQNTHSYTELCAKAERSGINTKAIQPYLDAHKYGLPPHGSASMGLERFVMKLCGLENIREARLFPRDMHILD